MDPEISISPSQVAGVWANYVLGVATPHEFTLDFARLDPHESDPPRGVLVARVSFSNRLLPDLLDLLNDMWTTYADRSLPKEVRGDDEASHR